MSDIPRARTLAERLFDGDTLLQRGLSANECRELYYDMRRFFDRCIDSKDVKKDLRKYCSCGRPHRGDPVVADRRVMIRTGLLIGCILVRDSEGDQRAGEPFPSRENVHMYPDDYKYTVLDMFLSKQFNNDRVARTSEGIRETLESMCQYHTAISNRISMQQFSSIKRIRVHNKIVVVFSKPTRTWVLYASTTAVGNICKVSNVFLVHIMYSIIQENHSGDELIGIYDVTTEPARDGIIPVVDWVTRLDSPVSESKQEDWMSRWRRALRDFDGDWHCFFCKQARDRYHFGNLPFDVCKTCFSHKVIELREYLKNASNRGESGKFDFEHLFNTLYMKEA